MSKHQHDETKKLVIISAAILSIIALFIFLRNYFILIAVSAIMAYLFNPIYTWLKGKLGESHGKAIALTVIILFVTIAVPLAALLAITIDQAAKLIDQVTQAVSSSGSFSDTVNSLINGFNDQANNLPFIDGNLLSLDQIIEWLRSSASTITSSIINFAKSFAGGIASFFTTLILFLFVFSSLLKNQKSLVQALDDLNPLGEKLNQTYLKRMGDMTTAMVKGQFAIAILQGISGAISLKIAGVDYFAFWFVVLTFLSIIPLGGGIILIPLALILMIAGNIWPGIIILAWHFLITTNIDNFIRPKFVPKSARLDPALTILSVFAGIGLFGFIGIVLGPVIMIMLLTTIEVYLDYARSEQSKKNTSS